MRRLPRQRVQVSSQDGSEYTTGSARGLQRWCDFCPSGHSCERGLQLHEASDMLNFFLGLKHDFCRQCRKVLSEIKIGPVPFPLNFYFTFSSLSDVSDKRGHKLMTKSHGGIELATIFFQKKDGVGGQQHHHFSPQCSTDFGKLRLSLFVTR